MKILQIASTIGNIGDDASHIGLRSILGNIFPEYSFEQINIRRAYSSYSAQDRLIFDTELVQHMNKYDLCILGGGAFLDHPVNNSASGATIDFSQRAIEAIKTKTIFASIGCRPKSDDPEAKSKIKIYLDAILENEKCSIFLRNDGSKKYLEKCGYKNQRLVQILDHGFFLQKKHLKRYSETKKYACINLVNDQQNFFGNSSDFTRGDYHKIMREYVIGLLKSDVERIYLVPHIPSDLIEIANFMQTLNQKIVNENITVASLEQGEGAAKSIFGLYAGSQVNIGTRFHTNVCSLALGRPTIPIAITARINELYDSIGGTSGISRFTNNIQNNIFDTISRKINNVQSRINIEREYTRSTYINTLFST